MLGFAHCRSWLCSRHSSLFLDVSVLLVVSSIFWIQKYVFSSSWLMVFNIRWIITFLSYPLSLSVSICLSLSHTHTPQDLHSANLLWNNSTSSDTLNTSPAWSPTRIAHFSLQMLKTQVIKISSVCFGILALPLLQTGLYQLHQDNTWSNLLVETLPGYNGSTSLNNVGCTYGHFIN